MDPDDFSDVSASDEEGEQSEEAAERDNGDAVPQQYRGNSTNGLHSTAAVPGLQAEPAPGAPARSAAAAAHSDAEAALLAGELTGDAALLQLQVRVIPGAFLCGRVGLRCSWEQPPRFHREPAGAKWTPPHGCARACAVMPTAQALPPFTTTTIR